MSKVKFSFGSLSIDLSNDSPIEQINGRIDLKLKTNIFIRGIWIKFVGIETTFLKQNQAWSDPVYILKDHEDFYLDGIHEVFTGFGEQDDDKNSVLELPSGKHSWNFCFQLSQNIPTSLHTSFVKRYYNVIFAIDAPMINEEDGQIVTNASFGGKAKLRFQETRCYVEREECVKTANIKRIEMLLFPRVKSILGLHFIPKKVNLENTTKLTTHSDQVAVFPFAKVAKVIKVLCHIENIKRREPMILYAKFNLEVSCIISNTVVSIIC